MFEGSLFGIYAVTRILAATLLDHVDIYVNAAQVVILATLAYLGKRNGDRAKENNRQLVRAHDKIGQVQESVNHAASAAASAADAAAQSARITKEIGSAIRDTQTLPPPL